MKDEIQPYRELPLDTSDGELESEEQYGQEASALRYLEIFRRRWKTVALVWLLLVIPAVAGVWKSGTVSYTATGLIEVLPATDPVLYDLERQTYSFDIFLNTQAQIMVSPSVLRAALMDPRIRDLDNPLLTAPNPVAAITGACRAQPTSRSYLVQLEVDNKDPGHAKLIANAIMDAYLQSADKDHDSRRDNYRKQLETELANYRVSIDNREKEISRLAEEFGTSSASTFDVLRQTQEESTQELKRQLGERNIALKRLEYQLERASKGLFSEMLPEESIARQQELIERDYMVSTLQNRLTEVSMQLARLRQRLSAEAKAVIEAEEELDRLAKDLDRARLAAADRIQEQQSAVADKMREGLIRNLENQKSAAERDVKELEGLLEKATNEGLRIGRVSRSIEQLKEEVSQAKQERDLRIRRLQEMETESHRPKRITKKSEADIPPDGVKDSRKKYTMVVFMGTLFFAVAAAFLKDYLDPRIHAPQQVESGLGLRLLGLVPSLKDLKEGRITEGEFAESYRLVRACLSVAGTNGSTPRSILTTSAQACEGKTSLAVSLAASLAEAGNSVLLIDGDIQGPQVERVLKLDAIHTLKDVLAGEVALPEAVVRSSLQHLEVLVARLNSGTARGVLNTRTAVRLIKEAMERYDYVVVDSPPTLGAADAVVWAEAVDGVILSSFAGQSNSHAMKTACQRLRSVGAKILGAVMCNLSIKEGYYSFSTSGVPARSTHPNAAQNGYRAAPHVQLPVVEIHPSEPGSKSV